MSVDLQSVNVSIAGRQIVRDVCLQIRDGQRVGLIGSSGSGKSMIARAIMGLLPQDTQLSGSINVNGTQTVGMNDVQLARLRGAAMGMVFQNPAASLNPLLRVREQIELPLKLHYDLPAHTAPNVWRTWPRKWVCRPMCSTDSPTSFPAANSSV